MEFPFQPYRQVSMTLTLQLFKPSFQDVRVLHLINKCCWGQAGLSVPAVQLHGLSFRISLLNIPQIQNEWEVSCIAQQRQPFPLKIYQILWRGFPDKKIKVLYIQNALVCPPLLDSLKAVASVRQSLKKLPPVLFFYCMSHFVQ